MYKTRQPKVSEIKRGWYLVDAKGKVLGRMATEIAGKLMGKHKREYAPNQDMGDWVVVVNAKKVELTGKKEKQKVYYSHSGYPKGLKARKYSQVKREQPEKVIKLAVSRMLPTNRLKKARMARLRVFAGEEHHYQDKFVKEGKK